MKRLIELKSYFAIMVEEGVIDEELNLVGNEWGMMDDIAELLEPFMSIQRVIYKVRIMSRYRLFRI